MKQSVAQFFDAMTSDYMLAIERCFPWYRDMYWALLDYLPQHKFTSILELGAGTGNLSIILRDEFPTAQLTLVDISGDSLAKSRERMTDVSNVDFRHQDFRDLQFEPEQFDLVISAISIHHLTAPEKQTLFDNVFSWMKPGGTFAFADQCAGTTDALYARHMENWQKASLQAGATQDEWDMWMQHQQDHDHHDSLGDQMAWLGASGFTGVDCVWRCLLWSVIQAAKPKP